MGVYHPVRSFIRPVFKSISAAIRWKRLLFNDVPPVFGNAKPKSGSHLLLQILNGFCQIMPYRYVEAAPIRTITRDGHRRSALDIQDDIWKLPASVMGWGYLEPTPEIISILCRPGRVNFFIYRDPRDLLVSQVYFATEMDEEHGMHEYYMSLPDYSTRLKAAITGVTEGSLKMVSIRERYDAVFKWLEQKHVLCIRFENLINNRDTALNEMLNEVEKTGYKIPVSRGEALSSLTKAIQPERSHTFRSGKTGGWREHFNDEHKKLFKEVAGDLLVRLGYETSNDW